MRLTLFSALMLVLAVAPLRANDDETFGTMPRTDGNLHPLPNGHYLLVNDDIAPSTFHLGKYKVHAVTQGDWLFETFSLPDECQHFFGGSQGLVATSPLFGAQRATGSSSRYSPTTSDSPDPRPLSPGTRDPQTLLTCWQWIENQNVTHCVETPHRGSESAGHQANRHATSVQALMQVFPPMPAPQ